MVVDLSNEAGSAKGSLNIDKLNLKALNLYDEAEDISGDVLLDMTSLDPKNLLGTFSVEGLRVGSINIGQIKGEFDKENDIQKVEMNADFMKVKLAGNFDYAQLSDVMLYEIDKYFALEDSLVSQRPYPDASFDLNASLMPHPIWGLLVPDFRLNENATLNAKLNNSDLEGELILENLVYAENQITNLKLDLDGNGNRLKADGTVDYMLVSGISLPNNTIELNLENGEIRLDYLSKDSSDVDKLGLKARLTHTGDSYQFYPEKMTISGEEYLASGGPLVYKTTGELLANRLTIKRDDNVLAMLGSDKELVVDLLRWDITPFMKLLGYASDDFDGMLSGQARLNDLFGEYRMAGELKLTDFSVQGVPAGNVAINVKDLNEKEVLFTGKITGLDSKADFEGNVQLTGNYPMSIEADISKLDARIIQGFGFGTIRNSSGYVQGDLVIGGDTENPAVDGEIKFQNFKTTIDYLGAPFALDNQTIRFNGTNVQFNNFQVTDSTGQKLVLDGTANWANLDKVKYNMTLTANDFMVLNASKSENDLVYGKAFIDAEVAINGVGSKPSVEGNITVTNASDITFIMPQTVENAQSQGIVYFVPPADSSRAPRQRNIMGRDSSEIADLASLASEIILDIATEENAKFTVIIDELNGDNLKVSGSSNLTFGLYPSGEFYMVGLFEVTRGTYDFSLEFLRRSFQLEPGSTILWTGDPYQATLNLKAYYEVNADLQSLNNFGLNIDQFGKVPLDVLLELTGTIEEPQVKFDLRANEKAESSIKSLIETNDIFGSLRNNPNDMNQQVFSLLVFNRFLTGSSLSFGSNLSTQAIARQSVSKVLTEQLNVLAGDLLGSVGLNFGLNSDKLNSTSGSAYRTDLSVNLKKSFLNDRVSVSVGKNFELENTTGASQSNAEVLDNINVNYKLTSDGKYALNVYRNNQYQTILEGFIVETGVSFVLTADYNVLKDLIKTKDK